MFVVGGKSECQGLKGVLKLLLHEKSTDISMEVPEESLEAYSLSLFTAFECEDITFADHGVLVLSLLRPSPSILATCGEATKINIVFHSISPNGMELTACIGIMTMDKEGCN